MEYGFWYLCSFVLVVAVVFLYWSWLCSLFFESLFSGKKPLKLDEHVAADTRRVSAV